MAGTGTSAAVAIVAYAAFFPLIVNAVAGAKHVNPTLLRAAATMGLDRITTIRTVVIPAALPSIGVGLRIAMGVGWTAIVAAELAVGAKAGGGGSGGIGQMMFVFYAYSIELNRIIVCMLAVGLALLLDWMLRTMMRNDAMVAPDNPAKLRLDASASVTPSRVPLTRSRSTNFRSTCGRANSR